MTRFLKIFDILPGWIWALVAAGFLAVSLTVAFKLERAERQLSDLKAQHATELADQAEASKTELERLTKANREIQSEYMDILKAFAVYRADVARAERMRTTERQAIVDAAGRVAGACGRYADAAERDIAAVEGDAVRLGQEAHRASAAHSAVRKTLDERRAALEARRKALKPQEN
jgi:chromosome segregation ATPase